VKETQRENEREREGERVKMQKRKVEEGQRERKEERRDHIKTERNITKENIEIKWRETEGIENER
jgi:hypothetical protein